MSNILKAPDVPWFFPLKLPPPQKKKKTVSLLPQGFEIDVQGSEVGAIVLAMVKLDDHHATIPETPCRAHSRITYVDNRLTITWTIRKNHVISRSSQVFSHLKSCVDGPHSAHIHAVKLRMRSALGFRIGSEDVSSRFHIQG